MNIRNELFKLKDEEYRKFQSKLIPTVAPERIIGVRMPMLRKLVKEFLKNGDTECFLMELPHKYYEEDIIHALVIAQICDFEKALTEIWKFLPYIDNWAVCDMPPIRVFAENRRRLLPYVEKWLGSEHTYTVRFGIKVLMDMFLDEDFDSRYPAMVAMVKSEEYYVNMMIAWYFATALAKQYDEVIAYIEEKRLAPWVHNKTIQKAVESYRIGDEVKEYLKTLRLR